MKIMNISHRTGWGGAEAMAMNYAVALQDRADVVNVVPPCSVLFNKMSDRNLNIHTFTAPKLPIQPATIRDIRNIITAERPDAVVSHNLRASWHVKAAQKFAGNNAPVIQVVHSEKVKCTKRNADGFILVSEGLAQVQSTDCQNIRTVQNFIDLKPSQLQEKPVSTERATLGFLGRFSTNKGAYTFLDLISTLRNDGLNVHGKMAGGKGKRLTKIQTKAEKLSLTDSIDIDGWIEDREQFFNGVDVLIVPSLEESFSLATVEAWRHGVPVISTRTSGPSSLIEHKKTGMLCGFDTQDLADSVKELCANPALYQAMRQNARKAFLPYALTDEKSEELFNTIRELTANARPQLLQERDAFPKGAGVSRPYVSHRPENVQP